jgi:hypothetical protein
MPGAFLWDDRVASVAAISAPAGTPVATMPLSNLLDPQPRIHARLIGSTGALLVNFSSATTIDAVALISTNLPTDATIRCRVGAAPSSFSFDTGVLAAGTATPPAATWC